MQDNSALEGASKDEIRRWFREWFTSTISSPGGGFKKESTAVSSATKIMLVSRPAWTIELSRRSR